jgi:hypothetical protein
MNRNACATAIAIIAALSLTATAQEKKITQSALPAPVQKTVQANSQGATIKGYTAETENGKKMYEAEMIVNGHTKDLEIAADGTINAIEEQIAFNAAPSAVRTALTKNAAGAKITKVETITKQGKLVAYEAATLKGTKRANFRSALTAPNSTTKSRHKIAAPPRT